MTTERRRHERYSHVLEGQWKGASGAGTCRITDISLGGCFIQSLAMPAIAEETTVTIHVGDHRLAFAGKIAYVEQGMGFAVQFQNINGPDLERLVAFIETLRKV